jgi:ATP-dependent DNA ligase
MFRAFSLQMVPLPGLLSFSHVAQRTLAHGFIPPCLPTKAPQPPSGTLWLHEIKHDGFRVIARKKTCVA